MVIVNKYCDKIDEITKVVQPYADRIYPAPYAEHILDDLEGSLCQLGTDTIDAYQIRIWRYDIKISIEIQSVLEDFVKKDKSDSMGGVPIGPTHSGLSQKARFAQCSAKVKYL